MQDTIERIKPQAISPDDRSAWKSLQLHLARYHFAGKHLVPGAVVDLACGTGYGSHLLANEYGSTLTKIYAVDNNPDAIHFARTHFPHPLIEFVVADAMQLNLGTSINNVVSLETLEHLREPAAFVQQMSNMLPKGGRFIVSIPITPSVDANPYHLHDLTIQQLIQMMERGGLNKVDAFIQTQRFNPLQLFSDRRGRHHDLRKNIVAYYWNHPSKFFLRIKSVFQHGFANKYYVAVFEK